jgi:hypothetical protein
LLFVIVASKLVDYNAIEAAIERIKAYMRFKGWTK